MTRVTRPPIYIETTLNVGFGLRFSILKLALSFQDIVVRFILEQHALLLIFQSKTAIPEANRQYNTAIVGHQNILLILIYVYIQFPLFSGGIVILLPIFVFESIEITLTVNSSDII